MSSGNPPNELLALSYAGGISDITLEADPGGTSFVMDDMTYTTPIPNLSTVPEPSAVFLLATALLILYVRDVLRRQRV